MGRTMFETFSKYDALYGLFIEDLLNNNKGTKFFTALGKLLFNRE